MSDLDPSSSRCVRLPLKERIKEYTPRIVLLVYRLFRARIEEYTRFFRTGDLIAVLSFLFAKAPRAGFLDRWRIVSRLYRITYHVPCYHLQSEILAPVRAVLMEPAIVQGVVVEAGCFKGGGTAKLSVAAKYARRGLVAFDSFEGIPENSELHDKNIWGGLARFSKGDYCGALEEVTENVRKFGELEGCRFIKGFFDETMPQFNEPVIVAYLDVDLASSTRTCLKYLWPLLVRGGILFSHDGHLPLVLEAFNDDEFWQRELNTIKPQIHGYGHSKVLWCRKD